MQKKPADNAEAVVTATRQLTTREFFQLSSTKVTVSTVAPTPEAFAAFASAPCVLAWSVHAANDVLRRKLVPTTKYSMIELRQGLIDALNTRGQSSPTTMLEVALMAGINDSAKEAEELATFSRGLIDAVPGLKLMVNLIPYNPGTETTGFQRPDQSAVRSFQQSLWNAGIYAHVRTTRGDDENAACGQLVTQRKQPQRRWAVSAG